MMNLVTGATGFIGSHLVDSLLASGARVRALVRNPDRAAPWQESGAELVAGDLRDAQSVRAAVRGSDVIYHCAAATGANLKAQEIHDTHVGGLRHLLDAMRENGGGRLVLLSGLSVLGLGSFDSMSEDLPCRPCYDPEVRAKIDAEELAREYHRRHRLEMCILRAGFVYGTRDQRNLPQLVDAVRRGKFLYIGSRHNVVPLVHVHDMVHALMLAARRPAANGRIYHIADGSRTTMRQLVTHIVNSLGCSAPRWTLPFFLTRTTCVTCEWLGHFLGWPPGGPIARGTLLFLGTSRFVDIRRAKEELGFAPQIDLQQGIAEAVRCLSEQSHERPNLVRTAS
jgi:2-alkyl-3-oxoalkanoate reductase